MNYNIITVSFGALRKITGPSVSYQYDAVQYLAIRGLELPAAYRVDFCNDGDASTISMVATDDGVLIPDQLLATGRNIKAYIVLNGTDEGAVETRYEITLPVNKRPAPSDIAPTPAQQQQIDELIDQLSDALEKSVPAGGLAGQVLAKATDDDYDLEWVDQSGGGKGGTTNYNRLTHKPQINGIELEGNQSAADLGLATPSDIPDVPVQSVAGKTGAVDLNAGDIEFDDTETYAAGSIGAEVSAQKNAISQLESKVVTDVTVTGTDVTIVAQANKRYLCGTVSTIAVTPCATGAFDLIFTSGTSAAILTIPSTVKWQDSSFDPTALDTSTIYEISVADGVLGLVAKWT